jgi:hypothetical protein
MRRVLGAFALFSAVALLAPEWAAAQCCQKICRPDGSSIRCGNVINGTPLGCSGCTPPFTGPSAGLDQGCIDVGPAPENDPTKAGICVGGTLLAGTGSGTAPLLQGCICVGEFGCFDGTTANAVDNTTCRGLAVKNCGPNVVVEHADPDCLQPYAYGASLNSPPRISLAMLLGGGLGALVLPLRRRR